MNQFFRAPRALILFAFLLSSLTVPVSVKGGVPLITGIDFSGGAPRLTITTEVSVTNQIQVATNLAQGHWDVLTNVMVGSSPYTFTDAAASRGGTRFYRVAALAGASAAPNMALIPAGPFNMGDTFYEGASYEDPVHTVYVSAFYLEKYEVTKELWDRVQAWSLTNGYSYENPGSGKRTNHPVQSVNWYDAVKWCNARSQSEGRAPAYYTDAGLTQVYKSGRAEPFVNWNAGYRLPSEAEWEKADRGGASGHRFPWTDADTITHSRANYFSDPSLFAYDVSPTTGFNPAFVDGVEPYTSPVGSFPANGYGVYDTAGNVWEWCWDYAGNYTTDPQTDPRGPARGSTRVGRGGNWNFYAEHCRAAYRYGNDPGYTATNIGFRCALPAP